MTTTKKRQIAKVSGSPRPGKPWVVKVRGEATYFTTKGEANAEAERLNK